MGTSLGKLAEYALAVVLLVLVVSLVAGHFLGQPVLLAYVETGSMEPTLEAGDGFVAIPSAIAGEVTTGDVVAFEAEQVHGGDLTTHRVIDERSGGYITQGDANPFTDQGEGEPPVTDGQVKAVALQVNGDVVRIPHLGTGVTAVGAALDRGERFLAGFFGTPRLGDQQLAYLLFGFGVLIYAVSLATDRSGRRDRADSRSRSRSRAGVLDPRLLVIVFTVLIMVAATAAMVLPAGTQSYGIVSTEGDSANPTIVPMGESDEMTFVRHNGGQLPVVSYMEPASEGVEVEPHVSHMSANETVNATITFHAPPETGYYMRSVTEYRYLLVLPAPVIHGLYAVHPWLPYVAVNAVIGGAIAIPGLLLVGPGELRLRTRSRNRRGGVLTRLLE
ncbi:Signal peptidase I [Halalkaliarchaeum sp. AArc-CO]|uniref:signal peptidase I n=1 Tax=Halalkaliarchaeum sp. AArc-CO TaxID=2866381 RepID=UPI00217E9F1A|nr:signal peptidase I [Halalkaliarchaeum sp. AArc-CO]UWG50543.1 Signal peptidase I [Halalkaliarchaeum sp. AArc-CO]